MKVRHGYVVWWPTARFVRAMACAAVLLALWLVTAVGQAQEDYPLEFCERGAFSTEEDFLMMAGEPFDGNPYISDGDLLSPAGQVCARNRQLLQNFDVRFDLGLDAVHVLQVEKRLVAFSTELASPFGTFTAGDLLFTNGARIPNAALLLPFQVRYDVGLDAVQIVGTREQLERFVEIITRLGPDGLLEGRLQGLLKELGMDIWFSIEGTIGRGEMPNILDGDLLSALGSVIARQQDLLTVAPAGIPRNGVDFGLDAVALPTGVNADEPALARILFSTEILYRGEAAFTDGDVLWDGGNIVIKHEDLILNFKPRADFLGLDALWLPRGETADIPLIQYLCSDDQSRSVVDFDGGVVLPTDTAPYTGLFTAPASTTPPPPVGQIQDQPCGAQIPIDGAMPVSAGVARFRVAFRPDGTTRPASGDPTTTAVATTWKIPRRIFVFPPGIFLCTTVNPSDPSTYYELKTDPNGWMDATEWQQVENGTHPLACQKDLMLAVWNSVSAPDPNALYLLWLEWDDGSFQSEVVEHHLRLDNLAPQVALNANGAGVEVRLTDGVTVVPPCGEETTNEVRFQLWAQFQDAHHGSFQVRVKGGIPPRTLTYPASLYNAVNDNTAPPAVFPPLGSPPATPPFVALHNTNNMGTVPPGGFVHIRDIDLRDFGESFQQCCYLVELRVADRAILHSFNGSSINEGSPHLTAWYPSTFSAGP